MEGVHTFMSEDLNSGGEGEIVNFVKYNLEPFFEYGLYVLAMIVIILGAVDAIVIGWGSRKGKSTDETLAHMRIRLSETITLGLTFILAAEVIKTFRVPNMYQLLKVALLVLLRQLITHFLDKDVSRLKQEYPGLITSGPSPKEGYISEPEHSSYPKEEDTLQRASAAGRENCVSCQ